MWRVPEIWKDGTCIVIGGGTSLIEQFQIPAEVVVKVYTGVEDASVYSPYLSLIHNHHVIAVNMSYKLGDWVDCVFFGDYGFWKRKHEELLAFQGLRVTCRSEDQIRDSRVKFLQMNPRKKQGITFEPKGLISWNFNSGAAAINLAIQFGVKKIILLGFDMNLDENKNQHWHKEYTSPLSSVQGSMKKHLQGFPIIAKDIEGTGIEIINCAPNSAITCFRKANIWEVWKQI
jgi:hypothetical protein